MKRNQPTDAIVLDREDLAYLRRRIEEQRSVHEMVLSVARLCERSTEAEYQELARGVWPGLAVVMDRMSADGDDLVNKVQYWNKQATTATGGSK